MPEQQREGRGAGYAGPGLGRQRKRWMTTAGLGPRRDEKMGQVLYFAYSSNLDDEQMRSRCASAQPMARAVLPNYALAFGGFSHRLDGAVPSVVQARGAHVQGLLYRLDDVDIRALDRFEGHPFAYERVVKLVLDEHGQRRRATTYPQPEDGFEPWAPPPGCFRVLWRAYTRLGVDVAPLATASGGRAVNAPMGQRDVPTRIFVYGMLLAGELNHRLLTSARLVGDARTKPAFELRDLNAFPGLVCGGEHAVVGEVYEVDRATLAALDRLEGHPRFYRCTRIALEDRATVDAYLLAPEQVEGRPVIDSGSWRARRKETAA